MMNVYRINRIRLEFKDNLFYSDNCKNLVLIESDWNLKSHSTLYITVNPLCINRIRLEFKASKAHILNKSVKCINRIRLEFKGDQGEILWTLIEVLIESDWNLKSIIRAELTFITRINRIRLEFKGYSRNGIPRKRQPVLIESDWNLKMFSSRSSISSWRY